MIDYDTLPYESYPFYETHPAHLESIATLYGLSPAPSQNANILEIGSSSGGNIIPLAYRYPDSNFIGIDLSKKQIEKGLNFLKTLNLKNIELICEDFENVKLENKTFDYIIIHGVFSWILKEKQKALLKFSKEKLSPNGLLYISYNTFPGWYLKLEARDLLLYHLKDLKDKKEIIKKGRELINDFLTELSKSKSNKNLLSVFKDLKDMPDWYIFHEFLEVNNEPLYFKDFINLTKEHGFGYLADSDLSTEINSPTQILNLEFLIKLSSKKNKQEQYSDFLNNKLLRRSILTHKKLLEEREITIDKTKIPLHFIASNTTIKEEVKDLNKETPLSFNVEKRGTMTFKDPIAKATFVTLSSLYPEAISFNDLTKKIENVLKDTSMENIINRSKLEQILCDAFLCGAVSLSKTKPKCKKISTKKPIICPFVREEAKKGLRVTGFRNHYLVLDSFSRLLIELLDGTNSETDCYNKLKKSTVELYDEQKKRTKLSTLSNLEFSQFKKWYNLVTNEFSKSGLFIG